MTLNGYTLFVTKFATVLWRLNSNLCGVEVFNFVCFDDLQGLLGFEKWCEFINGFMKRVNCEDNHHFASQAQAKGHVFLRALAEFCEPLIERTAEKTEGGQDAAKA